MDAELKQLRNQMNLKEDNFQRQIGQLKQQAKKAEEQKLRSQQQLQGLKRKLQDNKLRDIKYEHELALALKKTDSNGPAGAGFRAQFLAKPTSQLLPIGQDPRPNIINTNIKGFQPEETIAGGTFKTLRHQSQLIPVGAGEQTLMGAGILHNDAKNNLFGHQQYLQREAPVIGMQAQNHAPAIITNPGQIGSSNNRKKAELSLSLNGSAQQVNIPNTVAQSQNPYDSFPSIPDVNPTSKASRQGATTTVNQTLDGFTMNSIKLNNMNKKNHDRLANLQRNENLNYQESDPKDELSKLDDLLFSLLKSDDNGKNQSNSQQGKRPESKQNVINFEQQVRGMIQNQQEEIGGERGISFDNKEHSLRSFQAENQIYRDQMKQIYNGNSNPLQFQQHQRPNLASINQKYIPPTQKTLNKLPGQDSFNIDSFIMEDTRRLDSLKGITFKNLDSLQGINTMSLQGGGGTGNAKNYYQKQNTMSSIRDGSGAGGYNDLDSIDEAPEENSLKNISDALSGN